MKHKRNVLILVSLAVLFVGTVLVVLSRHVEIVLSKRSNIPEGEQLSLSIDALRTPGIGADSTETSGIDIRADATLSTDEENQRMSRPHSTYPQTSWRQHIPGEFFKALQGQITERYSSAEPEFKAHKSCKKSPVQLLSSFRESVNKGQLSGDRLIPEQGALLDFNIYFKHAGKFYQLSMEPLSRKMDEYKISLIQSSSHDFMVNLVRIDDGGISQMTQLSRLDAVTQLKNLMDDYSSQGAQWGTRTLLLASLELRDNHPHDETEKSAMVEYHNGAVRGFMNNQQECHLGSDGKLECLCP